ncbi:hypothetical protein K7432_009075 [Basidiobolus ranarum]|uniref:Uncharacterized protein n=1 Tax=Basidiobolus ranarum TaxID=34480 RepID=A0ABR2VXR9_9FUNG
MSFAASWFTVRCSKLKLVIVVILFVVISTLLLQPDFIQDFNFQSGGPVRVYSHEFSDEGLGNKFSEVLIGLYFSRNNGLKYKFNYDSFVKNHRNDDYAWFADLLASRYDKSDSNDKLVRVDNLLGHQNLTIDQVESGYNGFYSTQFWHCGEVNDCFFAKVSFFNAVRELQDLLNIKTRVHRVGIHLRFGDFGSFSTVEDYQKILRNLHKINKENIPEEKVHFVFYSPNDTEDILDELKGAFPKAQYHNMTSVEGTVKFLASSQYHITSGSSLSYTAAYLCPGCHIVFTEPKERFLSPLNDETINKTFYYMNEWTPYYKLLHN